MNKKIFRLIILTLFVLPLIIFCGRRGPYAPDLLPIEVDITTNSTDNTNEIFYTYTDDIKPIFILYDCGDCHSGGSVLGNFDIESYQSVLSKVTIGNSASSTLIELSTDGHSGNDITGDDLEKIEYWIDNNNARE